MRRERVELEDGDFLDLDWGPRQSGPLVIILHGLQGSSASPYARGLLAAVQAAGWRGVVMHFRGCSGTPNRRDRTYHAGDIGDLNWLVNRLLARQPDRRIAIVGYSLGGNVVLKWLAERGAGAPVAAGVAVSVPFLLAEVAERLQHGFSRVYQRYLLASLRRDLRRKFRNGAAPIDLDRLARIATFREFDEQVTAPLHGFSSADDYYHRASCRQYLRAIRTPVLILQARDDPFMSERALPAENELSPSVRIELSEHGGHAGFVGGAAPWAARYWLEERIPAFLRAHLDSAGPASV